MVTFGFFDGTHDKLQRSRDYTDFHRLRDAIDPFVDTIIANGMY